MVRSSGIYRSIPPKKIWTKNTHWGKTFSKVTFCLRRFFRLTEVEPNCSFTMTFYFQSLSLDWLSVGLSPRLGEAWLRKATTPEKSG